MEKSTKKSCFKISVTFGFSNHLQWSFYVFWNTSSTAINWHIHMQFPEIFQGPECTVNSLNDYSRLSTATPLPPIKPRARWISALLYMCRETSLVHATLYTDKFTSILSINHRISCSWLKKAELKPEQVNVTIWALEAHRRALNPIMVYWNCIIIVSRVLFTQHLLL